MYKRQLNARDFGWIGVLDMIERLEGTLKQIEGLEHFKGHLYNWYDTQDLRALEPKYISSVDSGNLAAHLIALANGCLLYTSNRPRNRTLRCSDSWTRCTPR